MATEVVEQIGTKTGEKPTVFLQPIAAPSILGLYGFAGATFMVAANMAGWYGNAMTPTYLFPFAIMFGGVAQFLAGMWAFRARDGLATAMHGMWGCFWIAYGILQVMFLVRPDLVPQGASFPALGYWFIVLAAITWVGTLAAMAHSKMLTAVLGFLSFGSTATAIAYLTGASWLIVLGGYSFLISAFCAFYDASAQMLKDIYGHEILKIGLTRHMMEEPPITGGLGEPGVIRGQK